MSKTTLLICAATLLIVTGLALGTRSGMPTPVDRSPSGTAESTARISTEQAPSIGREQHTQTPYAPDTDARANNVATTPGMLVTATPAANVGTSGAHPAMPWADRDEREVAGEIESNAERANGVPALPSPSYAEMQRLYELVPELAEDTATEEADLEELVDDPSLRPLPPGTAPRPGVYFEPEEDQRD